MGAIQSDRELIEAFLGGEADAMGRVDSWIESVIRARFRSLRQEWEDLEQETRARVYRNLLKRQFEGRAALRTYIQQIARNTCVDRLQGLARSREISRVADQEVRDASRAGPTVVDAMARHHMLRIIRSEPEQHRRLLELRFLQECSYVELSRRLGVPVGTIKSRLYRFRRGLRDKGLKRKGSF